MAMVARGTTALGIAVALIAALPTAANAVPVLREGFESGTSRWIFTGTWGLSSDAHMGSYSLADSPAGDYSNGSDTSATMTTDLDFTSAADQVFYSFWLKGPVARDQDALSLEYSTDGGATWQAFWRSWIYATWTQESNFVTGLAGQPKVRFRVRFVTDASGAADGVYFDDFLVDDRREYALITSPNGGENWAGGSVKNITWTNNSVAEPPASFRLLYSTDGGSTYPNLIASGILGSATSYAWTVPNLNSWTVRVRIDALDTAGNILFETTSAWTDVSDANFQIDSTPPSVFDLASPANGAWCTPTCTFTWLVPEQATIQLFVDGALRKDNVPLTNPVSLVSNDNYTLTAAEALSQGFHTWYVVAKDAAGNVRQSTSTWSVQVDTVPPAAPTLVAPAANAWVGEDSPTFSWTGGADNGSGLAGYEIWIDGAVATTGILPTASSGRAPMPLKSIFKDGFDTCGGWTMAQIPPSGGNWSCDFQSDIQSYAMDIYALATSGTIGSTATSGLIDLSNVGHALLDLRESICGAKTYQIFVSEGSTAGLRVVRDTPATNCHWTDTSLSFDDFTGGASSILQFTGLATPFNSVFIDSVEIQGVTGGSYSWQVVSVDQAGNKTPSETRTLRYDLPPLPFDAIGPAGWSNTATPTFSWNATTDAGSGLAKYQVLVDGTLVSDNISATTTSAMPAAPLSDGQHSWRAYAVDAAGALRRSRQALSLGIDTQPPQTFSLASPADETVVGTPTPSLCWNSTGDTGSGLDHYDLVIDSAVVRGNVTDLYTGQICATPTTAVAVGAHSWNVRAVDKAGNARNSTETWTIYFGVTPEPRPDGGADASVDLAPDRTVTSSTETSTATTTATTTSTATATSSTTATSTMTTTSAGAEPRPDGAVVVGADANAMVVDATSPDGAFSRDGTRPEIVAANGDTSAALPTSDASVSRVSDGRLAALDAGAAAAPQDGGRSGTFDGAGHDGVAAGKSVSSGCGCAIGAGSEQPGRYLPIILVGFLLFSRAGRPRSCASGEAKPRGYVVAEPGFTGVELGYTRGHDNQGP